MRILTRKVVFFLDNYQYFHFTNSKYFFFLQNIRIFTTKCKF